MRCSLGSVLQQSRGSTEGGQSSDGAVVKGNIPCGSNWQFEAGWLLGLAQEGAGIKDTLNFLLLRNKTRTASWPCCIYGFSNWFMAASTAIANQ